MVRVVRSLCGGGEGGEGLGMDEYCCGLLMKEGGEEAVVT